MTDSSRVALSPDALTRRVDCLYGQVVELLRRRRERRESATAAVAPVTSPEIREAGVFDGHLVPGRVDEQALEQYVGQLVGLGPLLQPYVQGLAQVDPHDQRLLERVEATRRLLERIYGQHLTFTGESRSATGTPLAAETEDVGQYADRVIADGENTPAVTFRASRPEGPAGADKPTDDWTTPVSPPEGPAGADTPTRD